MKIKIIQIGGNKDKSLDALVKEQLKRLQIFAQVEIISLKEHKLSPTVSKEQVLKAEADEILKNLEGTIFVLDEKGKEFSSIEFSSILGRKIDNGEKICFVIGGPFGLSDEVKKKANVLIALSRMTFTHQMVRLILLEQIYRGMCIIKGKSYHY